MIVMHPIAEQSVLDDLSGGTFGQDIDGYVIMDETQEDAQYLGHILYRVDGILTTVLACGVSQTPLVDGAVRACVAAGENAGATGFCWNENDEALVKWASIFCKNEKKPVSNERIFHQCK